MRFLVLSLLVLAACRAEPEATDAALPPVADAVESDAGQTVNPPSAATDIELRHATSSEVLEYVADSPAKVKIVNFWATWCVPCREEFPHLVRLQREMRDQGVEVVFVSADFLDQEPDALLFLQEQGARGVSFLKDEKDDDFIAAFDDGWMGELPTTIVYGPDDAKAAVIKSTVTYEGLRQRVLTLLNSSSS